MFDPIDPESMSPARRRLPLWLAAVTLAGVAVFAAFALPLAASVTAPHAGTTVAAATITPGLPSPSPYGGVVATRHDAPGAAIPPSETWPAR